MSPRPREQARTAPDPERPLRGETSAPPGRSEPVVQTRAVTKRFGDHVAVDAVDVRIEKGECWGLLGPNGAGKTTFLRMIVGSAEPSAGEIHVLGHPVPGEATRMRRALGVVPQMDNLDPDFTVTENLHTYAGYFGISGGALSRRVDDLLRFAALEGKANARINTLSGGMLRRLSLVRALVNEPALLVLDEPTTGLDPQARQLMWQRLRELRTGGTTLLLTTHYMEEAERLCDRVTVMDHGRILACDTPRALVGQHIEPQVVEVNGPGLQAWHDATGATLASRHEQIGESVLYYTVDEAPLISALQERPELTFMHRPANLEDVFLKLTGRELRDG